MKIQKPEKQNAALQVLRRITSPSMALAITMALGGAMADTRAANADNLPGMAAQPAEYFYTGKPYDADSRSYTFRYRFYDPEIIRWTAPDPAGFPDGVNGYLYVNNSATYAFDRVGQNLYTITNTAAVSGAGHAALISGSGTSFKYQSYGVGSSSSGSNTTGNFSSLSAAMQFAASNGYTNVNGWGTTPAQDQAAQNAMATAMNLGYDPVNHNCQDAVNAGLDAAGVPYSPSNLPIQADKLNRVEADFVATVETYE